MESRATVCRKERNGSVSMMRYGEGGATKERCVRDAYGQSSINRAKIGLMNKPRHRLEAQGSILGR